jgi:hypothetical protein
MAADYACGRAYVLVFGSVGLEETAVLYAMTAVLHCGDVPSSCAVAAVVVDLSRSAGQWRMHGASRGREWRYVSVSLREDRGQV